MLVLFGLNELDLILILFILIGALIGLARGALTQIISVVSIWLSLVVSLWLYRIISVNLIQGFFQTWDTRVSDMIAFVVLFGLFFHLVRLMLLYLLYPKDDASKKAQEKRRKRREAEGLKPPAMERFVWGPLNILGGLTMGVVLMMLWWAIILGIFQFVFQDAVYQSVPLPGFVGQLAYRIQTSELIPLYNFLLYSLFLSVSIFVPASATIVNFVLETINVRG